MVGETNKIRISCIKNGAHTRRVTEDIRVLFYLTALLREASCKPQPGSQVSLGVFKMISGWQK